MTLIQEHPVWWKKSLKHLSNRDDILKNIIKMHSGESLKYRGDPFLAICRTIVGQQISVKAAASVWDKIEKNLKNLNPKNMLDFGVKNIKKCGTSERKAEYIIGIAIYFLNKPNLLEEFIQLEDEEIIKELCKLKGIGRWSADMFLMFCLLRPNVLPIGDLGLRRAIGINYLNKKDPTDKEILKVAQQWVPYRSAATWFLWRSIDPITIAY